MVGDIKEQVIECQTASKTGFDFSGLSKLPQLVKGRAQLEPRVGTLWTHTDTHPCRFYRSILIPTIQQQADGTIAPDEVAGSALQSGVNHPLCLIEVVMAYQNLDQHV